MHVVWKNDPLVDFYGPGLEGFLGNQGQEVKFFCEKPLIAMGQIDCQKDGSTGDFGFDVVRHKSDGAGFGLIIDEFP